AGHEVDAEAPETGDGLSVSSEHPHLVALEREPLHQVAAEESRASRDENLHRTRPPWPASACLDHGPTCSQTMSSTRTTSRPRTPSPPRLAIDGRRPILLDAPIELGDQDTEPGIRAQAPGRDLDRVADGPPEELGGLVDPEHAARERPRQLAVLGERQAVG